MLPGGSPTLQVGGPPGSVLPQPQLTPQDEPLTPEASRKLASRWMREIESAEKRTSRWEKRCERIIRRFREDRQDNDDNIIPRRMNILWSNVQTLTPCVYGREPVPIAERRYLDKDVVGRVASTILERVMRYEMMDCGFHDTVEQAVQDYLLVGRGVAWLRYKPLFGPASSLGDLGDDDLSDSEDATTANTEEDAQAESNASTDETPQMRLLSATLEVDYVHWKDFLTSRSRWWKECEWIGRRVFMSRQDLVDAFGDDVGNDVPLESAPESGPNRPGREVNSTIDESRKAIVYEVWYKPQRKVYFIAKGYDFLLEDPRTDPLNLEGFWPCPKPLYATMTNDTLEPVPDYLEYQDQALEIDSLTNRIDLLIKALKVAGVYDASQKQVARLLDEGHENKLIAVSSWAVFAEKGGIQGSIAFLPIKEISDVLTTLIGAREQIKKDLYEVTGLSDVIRGQADPRETAEAVSTKGRWGSLRLQQRQIAVARFCRDIIRMMGEVISEHYPTDTLITISGVLQDEGIGPQTPLPPVPQPPAPTPAPPPEPIGQAGPPSPAMLPPSGVAGPGVPLGNPVGAFPRLVATGVTSGAGGGLPQGIGAPQSAPPQPGVYMHPPMPGAPNSSAGPMPGGTPQFQQLVGATPPVPPPPDPMQDYFSQIQAYQQAVQKQQMEKSAMIMRAIDLLRQDKLRGFRIDIETDSTVAQDRQEDKGQRIEFVTAASKFLEQSMQAAGIYPEIVPLLGKMMMFAIRGFSVGRDLESSFEEFIEKAEADLNKQQAAGSQAKPPSPEALKAQAEQIKAQAEIHRAQIDAQSSAEDNQREVATKQMDAQIKQEEMRASMLELQQKGQLQAAQFQQAMAEMQMKMRLMEQEHAQKMQHSAFEHRNSMLQKDHDLQHSAFDHSNTMLQKGQDLQNSTVDHSNTMRQKGQDLEIGRVNATV